MTEPKKLKIEFAPGAFDDFDGTQEELDELIAEIHRMVESGDLEDMATELDIDQLLEEDPDAAAAILRALEQMDDEDGEVSDKRNLQ